MLAQDIGVDVLGIDADLLAEQGAKSAPCRVVVPDPKRPGPGAEARPQFGGEMSRHVDRVGRDDQARVRCVLQNCWAPRCERRGIALQQLESCLAGLLVDASRDDHDSAAGQVGIGPGVRVIGCANGTA